jgi:Domain of unknown function (DUF4345)
VSGGSRATGNARAADRVDRTVIRGTAATLAAVCALIGTYAVFAPHSFYRHVVGVDALGPYNQHLLSDVGGLYLGFAVLFVWAARSLSLTLVRASCAAFALTQLMHFQYHATHLAHFDVASATGQTSGLVLLLALPAGGLLAAYRSSRGRGPAVGD